MKAPLILQIQKVSNIAVPSYQDDGSGGGVRLLKLQLTDGHTYCNALELKHTPQLKLEEFLWDIDASCLLACPCHLAPS